MYKHSFGLGFPVMAIIQGVQLLNSILPDNSELYINAENTNNVIEDAQTYLAQQNNQLQQLVVTQPIEPEKTKDNTTTTIVTLLGLTILAGGLIAIKKRKKSSK